MRGVAIRIRTRISHHIVTCARNSRIICVRIMTKAMPSSTRGNMTYGQKLKIIQHAHILKERGGDVNYSKLAGWTKSEFNLPRPLSKATISRIFNNQQKFDTILNQDMSIRRARIVTNEVLEESLVLWVLQMQHRKVPISHLMIQEKGREFARWLNLEEDILQFSEN